MLNAMTLDTEDKPLLELSNMMSAYGPPSAARLPGFEGDGMIGFARWTDRQAGARMSSLLALDNRMKILIAIRPVEIRLSVQGTVLIDGAMPSGTAYIGAPNDVAHITFRSCFDFLFLAVDIGFAASNAIDISNIQSHLARDPVVETLAQALVGSDDRCDAFTAGLVQALAARSLRRDEPHARGTPLPKWRLAKFERFVADRLNETTSLEEMAEAVGLSRMHFAKSFRLATGFTPHEYLLFRRIEWAKTAMLTSKMNLCEIALEAGFQAQAHFSTVFKRFTGTSPAQWKLANMPAT